MSINPIDPQDRAHNKIFPDSFQPIEEILDHTSASQEGDIRNREQYGSNKHREILTPEEHNDIKNNSIPLSRQENGLRSQE